MRGKALLKIPSGKKMTASGMAAAVLKSIDGWKYDAVSIGFPGTVKNGKPSHEPHNLSGGWTRLNYEKAFGKPVKILNDAAMQALGAYQGGRMLFLGLGTGLGSALIAEGVLMPLELAHLPYRRGKTTRTTSGCADSGEWAAESGLTMSSGSLRSSRRRWRRTRSCSAVDRRRN
jgi:polyphosphate glucokinase